MCELIIWINGAFGSGKTTLSYELHRRLPNSFVYDPENVGFFIRRNFPKELLKSDFQDHEEWREINYYLLHRLSRQYSGPIIVPMTLVNPHYFNEIITRLRGDGLEVKQFTLMATHETLLKRLKSRGNGIRSWPAQQIDRCLTALSQEMFQTHIYTDNLTVEMIIERISKDCKLELLPDHRGRLRRKVDQFLIQVKQQRR